jgi:hypothetical protein
MGLKTGKPLYHGLPGGQGSIHIHKVGQGILDPAKGRSHLHQPAQGQFPAQEAGNGHHKGKDDGNLGIPGIQPHQLLLLQNNFPEVFQQQGKTVFEDPAFLFFPMIESYAFSVLPHPHHAETEICLPALLEEIQGYQFVPHPVGQPGAYYSVGHGHPNHIPGNLPGPAQQLEGKGSGQLPENHHEGQQRAHRLDDAYEKAQGIGDEQVHVLTDSLVRVIHIFPEHLQPVIGLILEPGINVPARQPPAPVQNQYLLEIIGVNGQNNVNKGQNGKTFQLMEDFFRLIVLQGRIEGIVPFVQQHQHKHHTQGQQQNGCQEQVGFFLFLTAPIASGQVPHLFEQIWCYICSFHVHSPLH